MTVPDPTTTSLPTTPTTHLEGIDGATLTWLVVALFLAAGLVVIFGRSVLDGGANARKRSSASSLIRSWAAISFVGGLLILGAASFSIGDETVRSTLLGGIVASTGAVVAFYFSGRHAEQARQDMMDAAFGTVTVPNLVGKRLDEARLLMGSTALRLEAEPPGALDSYTVAEQTPVANVTIRGGSEVRVKAAGPDEEAEPRNR